MQAKEKAMLYTTTSAPMNALGTIEVGYLTLSVDGLPGLIGISDFDSPTGESPTHFLHGTNVLQFIRRFLGIIIA